MCGCLGVLLVDELDAERGWLERLGGEGNTAAPAPLAASHDGGEDGCTPARPISTKFLGPSAMAFLGPNAHNTAAWTMIVIGKCHIGDGAERRHDDTK
jgi:hypothetical protein